jgi:hypothetical protein
MRKSLTDRPMEDGSMNGNMMQFVFRKAVKEDVPKLIIFLKETIVEVYGQILAKGWKILCEEMDEEAGALKIVMTKTLTNESRECANEQ